MSAFARTLRKSPENRLERASRASHDTEGSRKTMLTGFSTPRWCPRSLLGALGGSRGLLWDPLGRQLGPLGALLGALWQPLGLSLASWARSWRRFLLQNLEASLVGPVFASLSPALGSVGRRKAAKTCREPAKSRRKLAPCEVPRTSESHKGAAVARSEFNPLHPSFTTGAKRSK